MWLINVTKIKINNLISTQNVEHVYGTRLRLYIQIRFESLYEKHFKGWTIKLALTFLNVEML